MVPSLRVEIIGGRNAETHKVPTSNHRAVTKADALPKFLLMTNPIPNHLPDLGPRVEIALSRLSESESEVALRAIPWTGEANED